MFSLSFQLITKIAAGSDTHNTVRQDLTTEVTSN